MCNAPDSQSVLDFPGRTAEMGGQRARGYAHTSANQSVNLNRPDGTGGTVPCMKLIADQETPRDYISRCCQSARSHAQSRQ